MLKRQSPVRLKDKAKGKPTRRIIDPSKRMLLRQLIIGFGLFAILGLMVAGIWYGTRIDSLTVTTVHVTGGETISHELVEEKVQASLEGNYAGLIPRRFAWWYPIADIYSTLGIIPRLKNPQVERTSGTAIQVTFDEYTPYALWCADRTDALCFFIDAKGYAFATAPKLTGGALMRYRTLGTPPAVGSIIATAPQLTTMEEFIRLVTRELKFEIASVETDTAGDVFYILVEGGELKATLRDPASQVFDNLRTILTAKQFTHIKPGNFQYIDLRFGSKVFVNEEAEGVASTTATSSVSALEPSEVPN